MIARWPGPGPRMRDAALGYAAKDWPVFPLGPRSKVPLISKADGGRGFHDATVDESQIREWWTRWPHANVGIATGHAFDAFDVDPEHGGEETLAQLVAMHGLLPTTRESRTGSGGRHVLFWPDVRVRCSAGRLSRGLDVRGRGGYIVAPPSVHPNGQPYVWRVHDLALAAWPPWLLDLILPPPAKPTAPCIPVRPRTDGRCSRFGEAVLRRACESVEAAPKGTRHNTLRRHARTVGGYVATGEISGETAHACLVAAAMSAGLPEREARQTADWAFAAGIEAPLARRAP